MSCPLVLVTDYAAIELYAFDEAVLRKYLSVTCQKLRRDAKLILQCVRPVLEDLFLIRLTNRLLGWNLRSLEFERYCSVDKNGGLEFDSDAYLRAYLGKNARAKDFNEFAGLLGKLRKRIKCESRCRIHGHDFLDLLSHYLEKRLKNRAFGKGDCDPRKQLITAMEASYLRKQKLFKKLLERVRLPGSTSVLAPA